MYTIQNGVLKKSKMFFYNASQSNGIFFYPLSVGHFYCDNNYKISRDNFDSVLITHIIRGEFNFLSGNQQMTVKARETAIIDCFEPHTYFTNSEFEAYWIHINGSNTKEIFGEIINRFGNIINPNDDIEMLIKDIYETVKQGKNIADSQMSGKIYTLITTIFEQKDTAVNSDNSVKSAFDFMAENYGKHISVDEIAKSVNMSSSQFSRNFKKQTGMSPYDCLLNIRLTKSKELLKNTSLPISEIAYQTGFANVSNFIYFFRKKENISPLKFRNILF